MTVEKTTISYHASEERIERLTACLTTLGYNDFVLQVEDKKRGNNTTQFLTDTGIIIVRNSDNGNLVNGYMATVAQAIKMYRVAGYQKMPDGMYRKVVRNNEKHKELLDIQKQFLTFQKFCAIIIIQKTKELLLMYNLSDIISDMNTAELEETIQFIQAKKNQLESNARAKAAKEVIKALKEYENVSGEVLFISHNFEDEDGFPRNTEIELNSSLFYVDSNGYLSITDVY